MIRCGLLTYVSGESGHGLLSLQKSDLDDAYGSAPETDGSRRLTVIYISGKRTALELEQNQANQQAGMSDSN